MSCLELNLVVLRVVKTKSEAVAFPCRNERAQHIDLPQADLYLNLRFFKRLGRNQQAREIILERTFRKSNSSNQSRRTGAESGNKSNYRLLLSTLD